MAKYEIETGNVTVEFVNEDRGALNDLLGKPAPKGRMKVFKDVAMVCVQIAPNSTFLLQLHRVINKKPVLSEAVSNVLCWSMSDSEEEKPADSE